MRAALVLVERGECAAGIVYATDARASSAVEVVAGIPSSVTYSGAIVAGSRAGADFLDTLRSSAAADVFRRLGFEVAPPDEDARP